MPLLGIGPLRLLITALSAGFQEARGTLPAMNVATELALLTPGNVITLHSGRELTQTRPDCEEVITGVPASKSVSASAMDIVSHPGFCVVEEGVLDEAHRAKRIYKKLYTHPTLL